MSDHIQNAANTADHASRSLASLACVIGHNNDAEADRLATACQAASLIIATVTDPDDSDPNLLRELLAELGIIEVGVEA